MPARLLRKIPALTPSLHQVRKSRFEGVTIPFSAYAPEYATPCGEDNIPNRIVVTHSGASYN